MPRALLLLVSFAVLAIGCGREKPPDKPAPAAKAEPAKQPEPPPAPPLAAAEPKMGEQEWRQYEAARLVAEAAERKRMAGPVLNGETVLVPTAAVAGGSKEDLAAYLKAAREKDDRVFIRLTEQRAVLNVAADSRVRVAAVDGDAVKVVVPDSGEWWLPAAALKHIAGSTPPVKAKPAGVAAAEKARADQAAAATLKAKQDAEKETAPETLANLLETYLTTHHSERAPLVADPEQYLRVFRSHYSATAVHATKAKVKVISVKANKDGSYLFVTAKSDATDGQRAATQLEDWYLARTKEGYKIDWPAVAGFNEQSIRAWLAGDQKEATMRVEVELYDIELSQFIDRGSRDIWMAYSVATRGGGGREPSIGHAEKKYDVSKRLAEILKDGQRHKLTVKLDRYYGLGGTPLREFGIKEILAENWASKRD